MNRAVSVRGVMAVAGSSLLLVACGTPQQNPPQVTCAAEVVQLLESAPLFTGPAANAALDRALPKGQRLQLCGAQGQRQQVLLPRGGQRCTGPQACAAGWIPRNARTAPL